VLTFYNKFYNISHIVNFIILALPSSAVLTPAQAGLDIF
jgi:hypothetical protein